MRSSLALVAAVLGVAGGCTLFTPLDGLADGTRSDAATGVTVQGDAAVTTPDAAATARDTGLDDAGAGRADGSCIDGKECDVVTGVRGVAGIFVTGSDLYYVIPSTNSIWRVATTGGATTRVDVASDKVNDPFDVVVTPSSLYWTERQPAFIAGRAIDGGTRTNFHNTGVPNMTYLTMDQGTLFASDDDPTNTTTGNVVCGNPPQSAFICEQAFTPISGVSALHGAIVFAEPKADTIISAVYGAGTSSVVGYSLGTIGGIAVDSTDVYFLEAEQVVARITLPMGIRQRVADLGMTVGEGDLAVDPSYVFVSEPVLGTIHRLPKPP